MAGYTTLYTDKSNGTFSDALLAFGLANLLDFILHRQEGGDLSTVIRDQGSHYELRLPVPIHLETLAQFNQRPYVPPNALFIRTPKNAQSVPDGAEVHDYEALKERTTRYFESKGKAAQAIGGNEPEKPHEHWDIVRAINPAALPGYNGLVTDWWTARGSQADVLRLLFELFSTTPNAVDGALQAWKKLDKANGWGIGAETTCQQLYNPEQGKGQNRSKADSLTTGNQKGFWLLEYLKLVGFYECAMTKTVRGGKDRKTFVIAPSQLSARGNRLVWNDFRENMQLAETSTRFDILAALRYTQAALRFLNDPDQPQRRQAVKRLKNNFVKGFFTAFYKDLGNAVATMNISFIALPGWVSAQSPDDATDYFALLKELETLVQALDESHSDAFGLLQDLRDFVSGDDLTAFFRFTNAYPAYYMGKRERNEYVVQLTTQFIERLIMSTDQDRNRPLAPVLENEGFRNIAYAIRQATVTAQYLKSKGERKYDVRYGLGQELARKARYKDDFVTALMDFVAKYNAENAQVMETRSGPYRRSIQTSDIQAIVGLMDEYGATLVANLLIAYGYARLNRDGETLDSTLNS